MLFCVCRLFLGFCRLLEHISKIQTPEVKQEKEEIKKHISKSIKESFNFEKPKEAKIDPIAIPPSKSRQSFELTTLTNISKSEPKFPLFEKKEIVKPMPKPKIVQTELIKPKEEIVKEIVQPKPKVEDKVEIIQSITPKPEILIENKPDLDKEVAKITEHKALPQPEQKPKTSTIDDDFDDDGDDLDKIKGDIMRVLIKNNQGIGLGSGRAATSLVKSLAKLIKLKNYNIRGIPTSLQIKLVAEKAGIELIESDQVNHIDIVFDGADQIDSQKYVIKGGGGALLRENILFSLADKVVVMADKTKFVKNFTRTVPIEIHPLARNAIVNSIKKLGGESKIRSLDRGYPFFTENGNIILDCDFGTIKNPKTLTQKIKQIPGVLESGIFLKKPDIIYKAKTNGKFEII